MSYREARRDEMLTEARAYDTVAERLQEAADLCPTFRSDAVRRQIMGTRSRAEAEATHLRTRAAYYDRSIERSRSDG